MVEPETHYKVNKWQDEIYSLEVRECGLATQDDQATIRIIKEIKSSIQRIMDISIEADILQAKIKQLKEDIYIE